MIRMNPVSLLSLAALFAGTSALAQPIPAKPADAAKPAYTKVCPDCQDRRRDSEANSTRTFYLKYTTSQADLNEIGNALRNLLPEDRIFLITNQNAIIVHAIPEDMALAERTINELDRQKKTWRLTYTITEVEGTNRLGSQHYVMVVAAGQEAILRQGNKVPIATSSYAARDASSHETAMTYQDVGMTFDTTLAEIQGGARLRSDIAQTGLADDKVSIAQDPVFRQATLRSEAVLTNGKPLVLGSMDIPGSTRRLEIEALIEPLP